MKKTTGLTLVLLLTAAVTLNHAELQRVDEHWLLMVDAKPYDVLGSLAEQWNLATRSCAAVTKLSDTDANFQTIQTQLQHHSPPDSATAQIRQLWQLGDWLLADVQFKNLLPAVVLVQLGTPAGPIAPGGIWSGTAYPLNTSTTIRRYLRQQQPTAPAALLACFDPGER